MNIISERERVVAIEMCRADGYDPYDTVIVSMTGENTTHDVQGKSDRWKLYLREARLFLAGLRAVSMDSN